MSEDIATIRVTRYRPEKDVKPYFQEYKGRTITVEPMPNFPVIKDLVVDMEDFMEKLVKIKPWLIREKEAPLEQGEYKQSAKELERYQQFSSCINFMLCYAACPIYGLNEKFLGPAATALAY